MRAISYLIIILFAPILILLNFRALVFNHNFYKLEFSKLNVYSKFQSPQIVDFESSSLIDYFCCQGEINKNFYSPKELLHLADVKNMISLVIFQFYFFLSLLVLIILVLYIKKHINYLANSFKLASIVTILSIFFLAFMSQVNFDFIFLKFHVLTFKNNYWLLPADANLIKLFPQQFFIDFANSVAGLALFEAVLILLFTKLLLSRYDFQKH